MQQCVWVRVPLLRLAKFQSLYLIRENGLAKTIILNEEADKYNNTPSQIWHNICKNYKVTCWFYIDDLFPKEGGEK